jgi:hypothetical protein
MHCAANRFVEQKDKEREYKRHLSAIAKMKPSIDTHQRAARKSKLSARKNPNLRIFDGEKAVRNERHRDPNRQVRVKSAADSDILSIASETSNRSTSELTELASPHISFEWRPKTAGPGITRPKTSDVIRNRAENCPSNQIIAVPEERSSCAGKGDEFEADGMKVKFGLDMWDTSDEETDCFEFMD